MSAEVPMGFVLKAFLVLKTLPPSDVWHAILQGNSLTANCGNSSFSYLDICDSLLNSTDTVPSPSPTSVATPVATPAATPAATVTATPAATVALTPAVTTPATTVNGVATDR